MGGGHDPGRLVIPSDRPGARLPDDPDPPRLGCSGLLALAIALPLIAGSLALMFRSGGAPGPAPGPARVTASADSIPGAPLPAAESPGPTFAADLAGRLLTSLPAGCVLEDVRVLWPGPWFSVRGHAAWSPGFTGRLKSWGAGWTDTRDPAGRRYENWFRRFETTADSLGFVTFEFLLLPEGMRLPE
jgi:hypothetical protein